MFTIIQEFTEKYRGFRGSLFSIHPLSGCEGYLKEEDHAAFECILDEAFPWPRRFTGGRVRMNWPPAKRSFDRPYRAQGNPGCGPSSEPTALDFHRYIFSCAGHNLPGPARSSVEATGGRTPGPPTRCWRKTRSTWNGAKTTPAANGVGVSSSHRRIRRSSRSGVRTGW